jgi:hypothetical protein
MELGYNGSLKDPCHFLPAQPEMQVEDGSLQDLHPQ